MHRFAGLLLLVAVAVLSGCKEDDAAEKPAVAPSNTASAAPPSSAPGNDIIGTNGRDVIFGTNNDDTIDGLDGDDVIEGGDGSDVIYGGAGNDVLIGDGGYAGAPTLEEASRFSAQASFGANMGDLNDIQQIGYEQWILDQMDMPAPSALARLQASASSESDDGGRRRLRQIFWEFALENEDQLRQRVAFALSQIVVVSINGSAFSNSPETYATYMDILQSQAFGNYDDLIREVSLNPAMGLWLTHIANEKADPVSGFFPDENYARELMQLFTIGLVQLNPDGTQTSAETYGNDDVQGLASVFTGLSWANQARFRANVPASGDPARTMPMGGYTDYHEPEPKAFLNTSVFSTDPIVSVNDALDHILAHQNVPPFISKQLIQRFVTSNPSSGYVSRVAAAYSNGVYAMPSGQVVGEGRRGDMKATIAAVLMDVEARSGYFAAQPDFGRVREPVLRFTQWARAFRDSYVPGDSLPNVGSLNVAERSDRLSQQPYQAPSVFNFYRPGYVAAGSQTASAGLVAPELQITTSATTAGYINYMETVINSGTFGDGFVTPDYTTELPMADNPPALIDYLDSMLTYGTLSQATKDRMEQAMSLVNIGNTNPDNGRKQRLRIALLMIVTSPEYVALR